MYKESVLWAVFLKSSKDDINNAFKTIKSLFAQSYNLPKVILSLTDNEIIKIDELVPRELVGFLDNGLFIEQNSEVSLQAKFRVLNNQTVLTVESGIVYPKNWLYCVMSAYHKEKDAYDIYRLENVAELSDEILFKDFALIEVDATGKLSVLKSRKIIVSMTSYPPRIRSAILALKSIYKQSKLPDKVILWLAESDFPNKLEDLPVSLWKLIEEYGLQIRWCKVDLKSHKKYFWAFKEYPDALIITVDDDVVYPPRRIENLFFSYLLHPRAVSAARACLIPISKDGEFLTCKSWPAGIDAFISIPSLQLSAIGDGGVLYPARLFSGVRGLLDIEAIKRTCLYGDDLWLKAMEIVAGIPVVVAEGFEFLIYTPNSQQVGLYHENCENGRSDEELLRIEKEINRRYGDHFFVKKLMDPNIGVNLVGTEVLADLIIYYQNKANNIKRELYLKSLNIKQ